MAICWVKPSLKRPSNITPVQTTISVALKTDVSSEGGEWLVAILGYEGVRGQHVFRFGSLYLYLPPFLYSSRPVTLWGSEYLFKGWPLLTAYLYHKRKSELQDPAFVRMFPYFWDSCLHTNAVCICRPRLDPFLSVKFDAVWVWQGGGQYFIFIWTWGITPVWIYANQIRSSVYPFWLRFRFIMDVQWHRYKWWVFSFTAVLS